MYSGDEFYGDEITSPAHREIGPRRISYRGVSAIWTVVHRAYTFRFEGETHRATTEAAFRWNVDSLLRRYPLPMNGQDFHHFGEE